MEARDELIREITQAISEIKLDPTGVDVVAAYNKYGCASMVPFLNAHKVRKSIFVAKEYKYYPMNIHFKIKNFGRYKIPMKSPVAVGISKEILDKTTLYDRYSPDKVEYDVKKYDRGTTMLATNKSLSEVIIASIPRCRAPPTKLTQNITKLLLDFLDYDKILKCTDPLELSKVTRDEVLSLLKKILIKESKSAFDKRELYFNVNYVIYNIMKDFLPMLSGTVMTSSLFPLTPDTSGIMKMKLQKIIKEINTANYTTNVFDTICVPL
jgi:hypothetical protein